MADLSLYKLNQKTQFTDISFYEEINFGNSQQVSFTINLGDYLDIYNSYYKCIIGPAMDDDGIGTNNKLDRISMAQISVTGSSLINNLVTFTLTAAQPTTGLNSFVVNIIFLGFYDDSNFSENTIISTFPYSTGGAITVGSTTLNGNIKLIGSGGTTLTPNVNDNTITVYSSTQGTATSASVAYTLGPNDSSTYSVGSTSKPVYFSNGIPLAIESLDLSSGAITGGNFSTGTIKPKATNTYDLGAADKNYKNLYLSKGIYFPDTTSYIYGCYNKTGFIELGYTVSDNKNINSIRIKSNDIILLSDNSTDNAKISLEWINSSDESNIYIGDNIDITANNNININGGNIININSSDTNISGIYNLSFASINHPNFNSNKALIMKYNSTSKNIDMYTPGKTTSWNASDVTYIVQNYNSENYGLYITSFHGNTEKLPPAIYINPCGIKYIPDNIISGGVHSFGNLEKFDIRDCRISDSSTIFLSANKDLYTTTSLFNSLNAEFINRNCISITYDYDPSGNAESIKTIINCLNSLEDRISAIED